MLEKTLRQRSNYQVDYHSFLVLLGGLFNCFVPDVSRIVRTRSRRDSIEIELKVSGRSTEGHVVFLDEHKLKTTDLLVKNDQRTET